MKLSAKLLESKGACPDQVELFRKLFGERDVTVTSKLCRAHADQFDWHWAAKHLLPIPASKAYQEATAQALKAYQEAYATALKAYQEAYATAFAAAAAQFAAEKKD